MGMKLFSEAGFGPPCPNPHRFEIVHALAIGSFVCLTVRYPDATTFEGTKILIYKGELQELLSRKELDPHFSEDGRGPIARFEPTAQGRELAFALMQGNL